MLLCFAQQFDISAIQIHVSKSLKAVHLFDYKTVFLKSKYTPPRLFLCRGGIGTSCYSGRKYAHDAEIIL